MKNLTIPSIIILLILSSCFGPGQNSIRQDRDRFVFWISVRAETKISRETKKEAYVIRTTRNEPHSGKVTKYQKFLHRSLKAGQNIPIGPFDNFEDAKRAVEYYKLTKYNSETMEKDIHTRVDSTAVGDYYWFFIKFYYLPRKRTLVLERTAARVAYGSIKDFRTVLWEGIFFKQLAVGPFATQEEAEEAKRLYRLEE